MDVHTFVSAVATALVHSLWQVALLGLVAALGFAALKRASAALRHTFGMLCLLAMFAAPLLTFVQALAAPATVAGAAGLPQLITTLRPDLAPTPWRDWGAAAATVLWMTGVSCMLVLRVGGWQLVRGVDRQPCEPLPPPWQARVEALRRLLSISRAVSVRLGRNVAAPFTAYLLRPVIYLPLDLLTQLPRDQVDALLAHELAHIRRLDWLWNLAQSAIEAVLFYHPAMWWLSRRIRQEREHACDAMAAAACGSPIPLAEALAGLQRGQRRFAQHGFALGAGGGTLTTRIRHLLSGDTDMPSGRAMGALLLLCGLCLVPGALLRAPLNLLVNVHVDESAHGPLAPGGFREIRARYLFAAPRYYRLSTGPDGMPHEVFREGGVDRPIDGSVRNWVSATGAMHEPFSQPNAAKMAGLADSITSDARVLAVTGAPAAVVPGSLHAQMEVSALPGVRLWGIGQLFGSRAGATAAVVGPKGRVQVAYRGEAVAERWRAVALSVVPAAR